MTDRQVTNTWLEVHTFLLVFSLVTHIHKNYLMVNFLEVWARGCSTRLNCFSDRFGCHQIHTLCVL